MNKTQNNPPMYAEPAYAQPMVYADPFGYAEPVPFGYEPGYEVMAPGYEAYGMVPMGAPGYARDLPQEFDESHHAGREDPVPMERLPMAPPSGRKKALVIGINYTNTPAQLRGCVADAHNIRQYLLGVHRAGWPTPPHPRASPLCSVSFAVDLDWQWVAASPATSCV